MIIPVTVKVAVASPRKIPRYSRVPLEHVNIIMNPFMIPNCCEEKLKKLAALIKGPPFC